MSDDSTLDRIIDHLYGEMSPEDEDALLLEAEDSAPLAEDIAGLRKLLTAYRLAPEAAAPAVDLTQVLREARRQKALATPLYAETEQVAPQVKARRESAVAVNAANGAIGAIDIDSIYPTHPAAGQVADSVKATKAEAADGDVDGTPRNTGAAEAGVADIAGREPASADVAGGSAEIAETDAGNRRAEAEDAAEAAQTTDETAVEPVTSAAETVSAGGACEAGGGDSAAAEVAPEMSRKPVGDGSAPVAGGTNGACSKQEMPEEATPVIDMRASAPEIAPAHAKQPASQDIAQFTAPVIKITGHNTDAAEVERGGLSAWGYLRVAALFVVVAGLTFYLFDLRFSPREGQDLQLSDGQEREAAIGEGLTDGGLRRREARDGAPIAKEDNRNFRDDKALPAASERAEPAGLAETAPVSGSGVTSNVAPPAAAEPAADLLSGLELPPVPGESAPITPAAPAAPAAPTASPTVTAGNEIPGIVPAPPAHSVPSAVPAAPAAKAEDEMGGLSGHGSGATAQSLLPLSVVADLPKSEALPVPEELPAQPAFPAVERGLIAQQELPSEGVTIAQAVPIPVDGGIVPGATAGVAAKGAREPEARGKGGVARDLTAGAGEAKSGASAPRPGTVGVDLPPPLSADSFGQAKELSVIEITQSRLPDADTTAPAELSAPAPSVSETLPSAPVASAVPATAPAVPAASAAPAPDIPSAPAIPAAPAPDIPSAPAIPAAPELLAQGVPSAPPAPVAPAVSAPATPATAPAVPAARAAPVPVVTAPLDLTGNALAESDMPEKARIAAEAGDVAEIGVDSPVELIARIEVEDSEEVAEEGAPATAARVKDMSAAPEFAEIPRAHESAPPVAPAVSAPVEPVATATAESSSRMSDTAMSAAPVATPAPSAPSAETAPSLIDDSADRVQRQRVNLADIVVDNTSSADELLSAAQVLYDNGSVMRALFAVDEALDKGLAGQEMQTALALKARIELRLNNFTAVERTIGRLRELDPVAANALDVMRKSAMLQAGRAAAEREALRRPEASPAAPVAPATPSAPVVPDAPARRTNSGGWRPPSTDTYYR